MTTASDRPGVIAIVAVTTLLTLGVPGCGRDAPEPAVGTTTRQYASAVELLAAYDAASIGAERRDRGRMLALVHPETERQTRLRRLVLEARPLVELDQTLWEHFGAGMNPEATTPPLAPNRTPAQVTTSIGHRARATYTRSDGSDGVLYLVRTDAGWWISGRTLERDAGLTPDGDADAAGTLAAMERLNGYLGPVASGIEAQVQAGELTSLHEAGVALGAAAAERAPELRDRPDLMFGAAAPFPGH